jgi:hypothetical protein
MPDRLLRRWPPTRQWWRRGGDRPVGGRGPAAAALRAYLSPKARWITWVTRLPLLSQALARRDTNFRASWG